MRFKHKAAKLVIELDGSAHDGQKGYDAGRDAWLRSCHGVRAIRFTNQQVFRQNEAVRVVVLRLS